MRHFQAPPGPLEKPQSRGQPPLPRREVGEVAFGDRRGEGGAGVLERPQGLGERRLRPGKVVEGEQGLSAVVLEVAERQRLIRQERPGAIKALDRPGGTVASLVDHAQVDLRPRRQRRLFDGEKDAASRFTRGDRVVEPPEVDQRVHRGQPGPTRLVGMAAPPGRFERLVAGDQRLVEAPRVGHRSRAGPTRPRLRKGIRQPIGQPDHQVGGLDRLVGVDHGQARGFVDERQQQILGRAVGPQPIEPLADRRSAQLVQEFGGIGNRGAHSSSSFGSTTGPCGRARQRS